MTQTKVAEIAWPPEWFGLHRWQLAEIVRVIREQSSGQRFYIAGGVLTDGTNLIGLAWTGGQNIARSGPATGWSIEERISPNAPPIAIRLWRMIVESVIEAKRKTIADLGEPPA